MINMFYAPVVDAQILSAVIASIALNHCRHPPPGAAKHKVFSTVWTRTVFTMRRRRQNCKQATAFRPPGSMGHLPHHHHGRPHGDDGHSPSTAAFITVFVADLRALVCLYDLNGWALVRPLALPPDVEKDMAAGATLPWSPVFRPRNGIWL
jgi:hypothetical protein